MSRHLKAELSNFIQARIPLSTKELPLINPVQAFMHAMIAMAGITEATGNNDGQLVNDIQYTVDLVSGESWCMATIQSALRFAELVSGVSSAIDAGGNCVDVFHASPTSNKISLADVRPGDIIIFEHGTTGQGHTEMVIDLDTMNVAFAIGGNTTPGVGYVGHDGVFTKFRPLTTPIGDMHIIGFLRPFV